MGALLSPVQQNRHTRLPSCFLNCRGAFYPGISGLSLQASFPPPPTKRPFSPLLGDLILTYDTPPHPHSSSAAQTTVSSLLLVSLEAKMLRCLQTPNTSLSDPMVPICLILPHTQTTISVSRILPEDPSLAKCSLPRPSSSLGFHGCRFLFCFETSRPFSAGGFREPSFLAPNYLAHTIFSNYTFGHILAKVGTLLVSSDTHNSSSCP